MLFDKPQIHIFIPSDNNRIKVGKSLSPYRPVSNLLSFQRVFSGKKDILLSKFEDFENKYYKKVNITNLRLNGKIIKLGGIMTQNIIKLKKHNYDHFFLGSKMIKMENPFRMKKFDWGSYKDLRFKKPNSKIEKSSCSSYESKNPNSSFNATQMKIRENYNNTLNKTKENNSTFDYEELDIRNSISKKITLSSFQKYNKINFNKKKVLNSLAQKSLLVLKFPLRKNFDSHNSPIGKHITNSKF